MHPRERFLAALRGDALDRPPVWLMRQAGRYLPGYRALRAEHSFWDVCQNPELSTRAALEPLDRYALDAAIVFSDILVVPLAMGLGVSFGPGEGPRIAQAAAHRRRLRRLAARWRAGAHRLSAARRRAPQADAARTATASSASPARRSRCSPTASKAAAARISAKRARSCIATRRSRSARSSTIADVVADLLLAQVDAGADAVQLFDSWGGLLAPDEYRDFALPALQRITAKLNARKVPTLLFVRGGHHLLPLLGESGVTGFSLDWRTEWDVARELYPNHLLQGNIDPVLLLGSADVIRQRTRALLETMKRTSGGRSCILNLGHGILPGTPPETVAALVETAAEFS